MNKSTKKVIGILTTYDWIYGITEIAILFLAIIAGFIAVQLFTAARKRTTLKAWRFLTPALALFALFEIFSVLAIFGIYSLPFLTHVIVTLILALLITALAVQLHTLSGGKQ